ncbi:MAG: GHMP kinase [Chloroflexi bacterium]|nr:MAG: GHMP kinase [Chloroflexota bacterium]
MIIVQTPLRVSLFGGGTDFPDFYREHGGCVLTSSIDKYIFVTIKKRFDKKLRVGYTRTEMVDSVDEIQHELIREAFRKTNITEGVEITTMGDIPSQGSGLGSSSTVTVGALHAMYAYKRQLVLAEKLAREACEIEIDILGKPIGIQDQYIAAYGGLRFMEFLPNGEVRSRRIDLDVRTMRLLNANLLLFFTGVTRKADTILAEQKQKIQDKTAVLCQMKDIAYTASQELEKGNIDAIGHLLHESWQLKKQLANQISNGTLDEMYETARRAGALGGKISGAGGGGFLLLYCPEGKQECVRDALHHLQELPFKLGTDGSKVIFDYQP